VPQSLTPALVPASASPEAKILQLLQRQTDYASYIPANCVDRCTNFATVYPACRAEPTGDGCMAVCEAGEWAKFADCLDCVGGATFASSLAGIAQRCVEVKGVNPQEGATGEGQGEGEASASPSASPSAAPEASPSPSEEAAPSSSEEAWSSAESETPEAAPSSSSAPAVVPVASSSAPPAPVSSVRPSSVSTPAASSASSARPVSSSVVPSATPTSGGSRVGVSVAAVVAGLVGAALL
jgi:hypothetical protein